MGAVTGELDDHLHLEGDPSDARAARAFVRTRLSSPAGSSLVDDASLVASELVANAAVHACTPVDLRVTTTVDRVRIEVHDRERRPPRPALSSMYAEHGRGLLVVSALAAAWGCELTDQGKVVWAELRPDQM